MSAKIEWNEKKAEELNRFRARSEKFDTLVKFATELNKDAKKPKKANVSWVGRITKVPPPQKSISRDELFWVARVLGFDALEFEAIEGNVNLGPSLAEKLMADLAATGYSATLSAYVPAKGHESVISPTLLTAFYPFVALNSCSLIAVKRRDHRYQLVTCIAAMLGILGYGDDAELDYQKIRELASRISSTAKTRAPHQQIKARRLSDDLLKFLVENLSIYTLRERDEGKPGERTLYDTTECYPVSLFMVESTNPDVTLDEHYFSLGDTIQNRIPPKDYHLNESLFAAVKHSKQVDYISVDLKTDMAEHILEVGRELKIFFGTGE